MASARLSTWLITGASSGFGKSLAMEALKAGHRLVGTSRDVGRAESSCPDFSAGGGIWVGLDPSQEDSFDRFAECAREYDVDVLVNNAGYAFIGGVEDTRYYNDIISFIENWTDNRLCAVRMSSGAGLMARPGRSAYAASKFAIEAIHESLSAEVKTLGIKILIVEPGAFRTPFASRVITPAKYERGNGFSEAYKGTAVEQMVTAFRHVTSAPDWARGDPHIAARAIVKAVDDGHEYLRLPLGKDCVAVLESKIGQLQSELEATRSIATDMDMD